MSHREWRFSEGRRIRLIRRSVRLGRAVLHLVLIPILVFAGFSDPGVAQTTETALGPATTTHGEGQFSINQSSLTEYTQHSEQAIVSWGLDFQQPAEHSLEFRQQPGFSVLNQSPGERPSEFYGRVTCDATCIFTNEAGIYFGDGSYVDVGRMFAVSGRMAESDFMAGIHHFSDLGGSVINHGTLRGERIALLGRHVANYGSVQTPQGSFMMLAGEEVWLREHGSPLLIRTELPDPEVPEFQVGVENWGQIEAVDGEVRLAAGDLLSFAIRQGESGRIAAARIVLEGGDEGLVEVSGELDARGVRPEDHGGQIDILGDYIVIAAGARLDASGPAGGGSIHVGGGRHGGEGLRTARGTFVHPDAEIRADASDTGDGGEIIIWADETAQVHGSLSARGGPHGGQGGFVETSGLAWLDVSRAPDLRARSGHPEDGGGKWLIDPNNINIVSRPPEQQPCNPSDSSCVPCSSSDGTCLDPGLSESERTNPIFFSSDVWGFNPGGPIIRPTVDDSNLSADLIEETLAQGVSVWIFTDTVGDVQGSQAGNIRVEAEIRVDDAAADPGTNVKLVLWAANDVTINEFIGVDRGNDPSSTDPTNLALDLDFWANSSFQNENVTPADEIPAQYLGTLQINASLETGGGEVFLQGTDIVLSGDTDETGDPSLWIKTDGGNVNFISTEGEILLLGAIDTSSDVVTEQEGSRAGGALQIHSAAVRRPSNALDDQPSVVVGGNIVVKGEITTGGGLIELGVAGGGIEVDSRIDSGGGDVKLFASAKTFSPVTSQDDGTITTGGRISLLNNANVETRGGDFTAGYIAGQISQATEIVMRGRIDTGVPLEEGEVAVVGGTVQMAAQAPVDGAEPGRIVIKQFEDDTAPVEILTHGSLFLAATDGSFFLENATVDVTTSEDVDADTLKSQIQIRNDGDMQILQSGTGQTILRASELLEMAYSSDQGAGNILFSGAPQLASDRIFLQAGFVSTDTADLARVDLGNASFEGIAEGAAAPTEFLLIQEADLTTEGIRDRIGGGDLSSLEELTLASQQGSLTVSDAEAISNPGMELTLRAKTDLIIENAFPSATGEQLEALMIEMLGSLTVDTETASYLSDAAENLSIVAGLDDGSTDPSLHVYGNLSASESLTLHGGADGLGDLVITANDPNVDVVLASESITLWAGDGNSEGEAKVDLSQLLIQDYDGGQVSAFTLRQDARIDDDTLPDASAFVGTSAGVEYTLRNDVQDENGTSIEIGDDGAAALADTRLRLYADGLIDLAGISDALNVRTMDIGGIGDFTYSAALNEKIAFTNTADSELVLRAGIEGEGVLRFEGDLSIQADEIRLVAGDGFPVTADNVLASIDLQPTSGAAPTFRALSSDPEAGLSFVFRQDADIAQTDLPDTETHFAGIAPERLAIRSDNGEILFDDFTEESIVQAVETIVLSAGTVRLDRQDGDDLVIANVLQVNPPQGTDPRIEIRSDNVRLTAMGTEEEGAPLAQVLPGDILRLTGFDSQEEEAEAGQPPPAFDFDTMPETAPDLISLEQNGNIRPTTDPNTNNLIDPATQLGSPGSEVTLGQYELTSHQGGIEITPATVNEAILTLALVSDDGAASETREIVFSGNAFSFQSLTASTPFGWTIQPSGGAASLTLQSEESISLRAGGLGSGDLNFGFGESGTVVLDANAISLGAGDDPAERTDPEADSSTSVVNAHHTNLIFRLREDELGESAFSIAQGGGLSNVESGGGEEEAQSLLPDAEQFEIYDSQGDPVDTMSVMTLNTIDGDVRIENLFIENPISGAVESILPTRQLVLLAGYFYSETDRSVILSQNNGQDLDLRQLDTFVALAPDIQFITTGENFIKLDDSSTSSSRIILLGAVDVSLGIGATSPRSILFQQEVDFQESEDCSTGCLPNPNTQLGPNGASGVEYSISSQGPGGSILMDDLLAQKVTFSHLTLDASNVTFRIDSPRDLDLDLASLLVGSSESGAIDIRFEGVGEDPLTIFTDGDQTYEGDIVLDGRAELTGDVITAGYTIEAADGPGEEQTDELLILSSEQIRLLGDIGQSDDSRIELLRLLFDPAGLGVPNVDFGGDAYGTSRVTADAIEFFYSSDLDATSSDPVRVPQVATLFKRNGDLEFHANTFSMGMGEKLSVQGKLLITALEHATLGDLSALEMTVTAPRIEIQRRPAGLYLTQSAGLLPDSGVDYVGNTIVFQDAAGGSPNIQLLGEGMNPVFGVPDPSLIPDWMKAFSTFQIQPNAQGLVSYNFELPDDAQLADLHPSGASRDDPSTLYFNQKIPPRPPIWQPSNWIPFNRASVEELDIEVQAMTPREYESQLRGATLIDDVGGDLSPWDVWPLPISEARLDGTEAAQAVELLHELFGPRGGRTARVRRTLQLALDQYRRNTGARRIVGFELRRYVKNRPSSLYEAYQTLEDLDLLFAMHRSLGLTPGEYRPIQRRWLELIKPSGITAAELAEAIHPSQYVRGSDVLDIFGD